MISVPRTSTPKSRSSKYNYKTNHGSSRSFTPLAIQPSLKKDSRAKGKKEHNQNHQISEPVPFDSIQVRAPLGELTGFNAGNLMDLGEYHKKQSVILKKKNDFLQIRLNDQQKQMQLLKSQLAHLKSYLKENDDRHLSETAQLRNFNQELQQKFQSQVHQLDSLKKQMESIKKDYSFNQSQSRVAYDYNSQDKNQISRRVQYVQHYEEVVGKLQRNQGFCAKCEEKMRQFQEAKLKYSNELRSLEQHVSALKEKGLLSEVLEKQMKSKNECIDYLTKQLQVVQTNSKHLLEVIRSFQLRVEEVTGNKGLSWDCTNDSFRSFGGYKY